MDSKYIIGIIVVIVIVIGAALVMGGAFNKPEKITIVGSTSMQPMVEKLAAEYQKQKPNVNITVQGGGSAVGLKSVQDGTAEIGMYSSKPKENDTQGISQYLIANDGIVIIVNKANNNTTDLTTDQVKAIFAGNNSTFTVVTREEGSGTRDAFISLVMGGKNGTNITKSAIVQSSTEAIQQAVKGNPNAIGFISLADLSGDVKAVKIGGVTPSAATVKDGTYKIQRPFIFLTKGNATGATLDFINWCLSPAGQKIVEESGAVPVK